MASYGLARGIRLTAPRGHRVFFQIPKRRGNSTCHAPLGHRATLPLVGVKGYLRCSQHDRDVYNAGHMSLADRFAI
jgi:hypothetical protein